MRRLGRLRAHAARARMDWVGRHMVGKETVRSRNELPPSRPGRSIARARLAAVLLVALLATTACTGGKEGPADQVVAGTEHVCSSCHGADGRSVSPTFPRLAGQQEAYIAVQLKAFRDHSRADPHAHTYMWGMAARLSDPTIDGLAAFYAKQPPAPGTPGGQAEMAAGEKIFREGIAATEVPACMTCHGEKAEGNALFPRLAGQHRSYLERQLAAFASNARANEIMHANSKNLTADQISQVAAFLTAQ
jgi:cytochrome c553